MSKTHSLELSPFAERIARTKLYLRENEILDDAAFRIASNVLGALGYAPTSDEVYIVTELIYQRKFMPGGRYWYASGRGLHQVQNCALYRAEDSREGWASLLQKVSMSLMTGAGVGVDYSDVRASGEPIRATGGVASGPIALMQMVNEIGRHVMQGGARRSAIWAGLSWKHKDVVDFIYLKNWAQEDRDRKAGDWNYPLCMELTNISVILDDEFFVAHDDKTHPLHEHARDVYKRTVKQMITTAEPGFSVDTGDNTGETLRNAPVCGDTHVLTANGYKRVVDIIGERETVWTGTRWAEDVIFSKTYEDADIVKVQMTGGRQIRCEPNHEFLVERYVGRGKRRQLDGIVRVKAQDLKKDDVLHVSYTDVTPTALDHEAYTLGYIYGDGSFHRSGGVDLTLCTDESKACLPLLVGAHSTNEHDGRGHTRLYFSVDDRWDGRQKDIFPADVYEMSNGQIASFVAGLFDADGNYEPTQRRIRLASKHKGFLRGVARALEQLGIMAHVSKAGTSTYGEALGYQLVIASSSMRCFVDLIPTRRIDAQIDDYRSYRESHVKVLDVVADGVEDVYCADVHASEHAFMAEGVIISNCTEVTSHDDSDICNLGSINLARISSIEEMEHMVKYATLFLMAGTVYSHLPHDEIAVTREKNRRLGLGIMGVHEWLLQRGKEYGADEDLAEWLDIYALSTEYADMWATRHDLSVPVKTRAIAPTGTIGIVAETTTGIEPIFCVAYARRNKVASPDGNDKVLTEYVIDPTAKRLIDSGVDPDEIEDAYQLSYQVERRVAFQAWVQQWVDHGISSTVNLPYPITDEHEQKYFAKMLYKYLPKLRGITCYPDGSRGGQPLTAVPYKVAKDKAGVVFEESAEKCVGGECGT